MSESYEVVERFSQPSARVEELELDVDLGPLRRNSASAAPASGGAPAAAGAKGSSPSTPRSNTASPRPASVRARQRTASPSPATTRTQRVPSVSVSTVSAATPVPASSTPSQADLASLPSPSTPAQSASQRTASLIQRQYIYFTTLLQEPEPKWKPVTDSRGVTVSQLDSIDRNLVVYRAEATFVGVAVWDLFAAISTPGVRKAWEPNADEDRLLEEVRLPAPDPAAAAAATAEADTQQGRQAEASTSPTGVASQSGNNSRSGLSRRTASGPPSQLWHLKQRAAWPTAPRDAVLLSTTYRSQDCSSVHHFSFSTSDTSLFPSIPPRTQGTIRSQVDLRGWSIEALNPTTAHVTLIEQSDPKGWTTKAASIPNAMISAVAGVGAWAIKHGGPPIVTHLSVGARQIVTKYEPDKGRFRLEYELDRSLVPAPEQGGESTSKTNAPSTIPPVIECELRCDLDLWCPNLDLIIDPPPIHVSVLRRPKLSRTGAGGGLWLTIEHASASLGALNAGDDEEDGMTDDVARITVRKGDGITSETGVVLINGARMTVEMEELDEEAKTVPVTRAGSRTKPKRAPLDQPRSSTGPATVVAEGGSDAAAKGGERGASPAPELGPAVAIPIHGASDVKKEGTNAGEDNSQPSSSSTTSALSKSLPSSSPMMHVLSRINAGSTATSSITNTQASGQLRIASGVEPPSRTPTMDNGMSRTGSAESGRAGASGAVGKGASSAAAPSTDKDKSDTKSISSATGVASPSGDPNKGANWSTTSSASQTMATQANATWKWLTKAAPWLDSLGGGPPAPRSSSSAAAAVLAQDEKRKMEREKAAARAAAKAAAKAKKGKGGAGSESSAASGAGTGAGATGSGDASAGSTSATTSTKQGEEGSGGGALGGITAAGESAAAAAKTTADAALAAATSAAANAQTGARALMERMGTLHFRLSTLVLTAVIAFLLGSLVRALLSPADFVLVPPSAASSATSATAWSLDTSAPNAATTAGVGSPKSAGSQSSRGLDSHLSHLLQDVLRGGAPASHPASTPSSSSSASAHELIPPRTYAQEDVERLLLKALRAGVSAGAAGGHGGGGVGPGPPRNVPWREIRRMIEIKGLMAGWDLVIAVVRR